MFGAIKEYADVLIMTCTDDDKLDTILDIYYMLVERLKVSPKEACETLLPICAGIVATLGAFFKKPENIGHVVIKLVTTKF